MMNVKWCLYLCNSFSKNNNKGKCCIVGKSPIFFPENIKIIIPKKVLEEVKKVISMSV
jgi:hypothetical protein